MTELPKDDPFSRKLLLFSIGLATLIMIGTVLFFVFGLDVRPILSTTVPAVPVPTTVT